MQPQDGGRLRQTRWQLSLVASITWLRNGEADTQYYPNTRTLTEHTLQLISVTVTDIQNPSSQVQNTIHTIKPAEEKPETGPGRARDSEREVQSMARVESQRDQSVEKGQRQRFGGRKEFRAKTDKNRS